MSRKKRDSPAASVVRQAQQRISVSAVSKEQRTGNRSDLSGSYLDESPHPDTGQPRLRVMVSRLKGRKEYDFSLLLNAPGWAYFLVEGFRARAEMIAFASTYTEYGIICRLSSFLRKVDRDPSQVDEAFWAALVEWLNSPRSNGEPFAPVTRGQYLGTLQLTVSALLTNPKYRSLSEHILYRSGFPTRPWPGSSRKAVPSPVLRPEQRLQIIKACLVAIEEVRQRYEYNQALIHHGELRLAMTGLSHRAPLYRDVGVCAAALNELTDDRLLSTIELRRLDTTLMTAIGREHGGIGEIRKILYAINSDLVPFIVLFAIVTAFNPSTVIGLVWQNIKESHCANKISITGRKPRGGTAQNSTHDLELSSIDIPAEHGVLGGLSDILQLLKGITARARLLIDPS